MKFSEIDSVASKAAEQDGMTGEVGNIAQSCPKTTLEIGVFFDGTLNNRYNVVSRMREDGSYQNALSNPALLYDRYKNGPTYNEPNACGGVGRAFRSIYVEGPGSHAEKRTTMPDLPLGRAQPESNRACSGGFGRFCAK